jgi:hypothetical protein
MNACSGANVRFLHNPCVRRFLLGTVVIAVALVPAAAAPGGSPSIETFRLPSKNIGCTFAAGLAGAPTFLRCDIRSGLKPVPRGPCELDWTGLSMKTRGRAGPSCAGDTAIDYRAKILAYGTAWKRAGFTCLSARIGLTCTNRTGNGFFLSRERWVTG